MCLLGVEGVRNLANCCIIFGTVAPFPSRGPHWRALALSILSPLPAQTLGAKPSMAQLGSLTAAKAAAQNLLDLWPVHGPAPTAPHYATHRWLRHLLEIIATGCSASVSGHSIPPLESSSQAPPCSCLCSALILMCQADSKLPQLLNTQKSWVGCFFYCNWSRQRGPSGSALQQMWVGGGFCCPLLAWAV